MATISKLPAVTVNGPPSQPTVPATPQFISLSELAHQPLTMRDLAPLMPATIISLVFNVGLVFTIIWYQANQASAGDELKKVALNQNEETTLEAKSKDMIDIDTGASALEVNTDGVDTPIEVPGVVVDVPMVKTDGEKKPDPGSGGEREAGFTGVGEFEGALKGTFIEGKKAGLLGDQGFGPMGEGSGLGGRGGGFMQGGGFGDRTGNLADKARRGGGNDASEQAVANGMKWLAAHQGPDGRWSINDYHKHGRNCNCKDQAAESQVVSNDTAGTALALLPFLGAGQTHKKGSFQKHIKAGLMYLMGRQAPNGDLGGGMYAHGLASIALCEAYALSQDPPLRVAAQRALKFIEFAQDPALGGWYYTPRFASDTDLSVSGWQIMALKSGQMAGLEVSAQAIDRAKKMLESHAYDGGARYSYRNKQKGGSPAMTAAGLLCRQYTGWGLRTPELHKGCQNLMQILPPDVKGPGSNQLGAMYYFYYSTQVLHHMGGDYWEKWNPRMRDHLIRTQEKTGHRHGSWPAEGADWAKAGGRIYSTSLAILTLEVYYRHLPLYRRAGEAMAKGEPDKGEKMDAKKDEKAPPKKEAEPEPKKAPDKK